MCGGGCFYSIASDPDAVFFSTVIRKESSELMTALFSINCDPNFSLATFKSYIGKKRNCYQLKNVKHSIYVVCALISLVVKI